MQWIQSAATTETTTSGTSEFVCLFACSFHRERSVTLGQANSSYKYTRMKRRMRTSHGLCELDGRRRRAFVGGSLKRALEPFRGIILLCRRVEPHLGSRNSREPHF